MRWRTTAAPAMSGCGTGWRSGRRTSRCGISTSSASTPTRQGGGIGRALVRFGIAHAARAGLPAFLETATERNVGFYTALGFRVVEEGSVPGGGPRIWFLRRDPD